MFGKIMLKFIKKIIDRIKIEINFRRNLRKVKKAKDPYLYK